MYCDFWSIVLGAEYLSYVKSIATFFPTFFGHIISVLASVGADEFEERLEGKIIECLFFYVKNILI